MPYAVYMKIVVLQLLGQLNSLFYWIVMLKLDMALLVTINDDFVITFTITGCLHGRLCQLHSSMPDFICFDFRSAVFETWKRPEFT